ncbi:phosphatase PAP2 family protein [Candidatus Woesearchaeota archaeon]|nr:phosphatase PAP2 family protein [Candidatus Woesearchaeota archaeon]
MSRWRKIQKELISQAILKQKTGFNPVAIPPATFFTFSLFGLPWIFVPLIIYLLKFEPLLALRVSLIIIANEAICGIIKLFYKKERPVPMPAKNLFQTYLARGFPSVHTARIAVFAIIISNLSKNPAVAAAGALMITAVASSRVYLKKHDWADVAGGLLIGGAIAAAGMFVNFL